LNNNLIKTDKFKATDIQHKVETSNKLEDFKVWKPEKAKFKNELKIKASYSTILSVIDNLLITPDGYIFDSIENKREYRGSENLEYLIDNGENKGLFDDNRSINIGIVESASSNLLNPNGITKIICNNYSTKELLWTVTINDFSVFNYNIIGNNLILNNSGNKIINIDLVTGKIISIVELQAFGPFFPIYYTKSYLWFIYQEDSVQGQDLDDPTLNHIFRYNPNLNEINELRLSSVTRRIFYVDNKLLVGDTDNKVHEINEDTGDIVNTYDLNSKLKKINMIFQEEGNVSNGIIEIRDDDVYYLYRPDNLVNIGKYKPQLANEYFIETEASFFGIDENTGERSWEIKKKLLEKEPKILHIDSRGVLAADKNKIYLFKP
jgi:outer membrane protein assembly factor BamB